MDCGSLEDVCKLVGKIPEDVLAEIAYQIILGLQHLHSNKFIHRDLKVFLFVLRPSFNLWILIIVPWLMLAPPSFFSFTSRPTSSSIQMARSRLVILACPDSWTHRLSNLKPFRAHFCTWAYVATIYSTVLFSSCSIKKVVNSCDLHVSIISKKNVSIRVSTARETQGWETQFWFGFLEPGNFNHRVCHWQIPIPRGSYVSSYCGLRQWITLTHPYFVLHSIGWIRC